MGYYSDVAVTMKRKDYERMLSELDNTTLTPPNNKIFGNPTEEEWKGRAKKCLEDGYNSQKLYNDGQSEYVRLHWSAIKWYGSPYIKYFEDFFLDNEVDFVRLGESSSDAEENWGLELFEIGTVRYLEFY